VRGLSHSYSPGLLLFFNFTDLLKLLLLQRCLLLLLLQQIGENVKCWGEWKRPLAQKPTFIASLTARA
jgi:hypothetical protein